MVVWNLAEIITLVRDLTGSPSQGQIPDSTIIDFINTYYTFEMPFELKEQINLQPLNFFALPNIDVYSFPGAFLTDQPMAYADGFPLIFYQDRDIFFQDWPQQYASDQVGAGNGVTTTFSGSTQNFPVIQGTYLVTDGSQVAFDQSDGFLYQTVANVNIQVGTINYVTGVFSVTFLAAPASGTTIYDKYQGYQPARPQGVLFYNNVFTFRPIPDQTYQITMQGYINQIQLVNTTDSPLQTEWGELIGYGAAIQIFSRRGDLGQVNAYYPLLKRYENIALGRYVQQLESAQSVPRF
jgi:hypothetical protein